MFFALSLQVRLIIVDCFATFLLDDEPPERIRVIYELLRILQEIVTKCDCAVVITNNMTTQITRDNSLLASFPKEFNAQILKPLLGEAFHHRVQQRILLSRSVGEQVVVANVQKNISSGPSLVRFKITNVGIRDIR